MPVKNDSTSESVEVMPDHLPQLRFLLQLLLLVQLTLTAQERPMVTTALDVQHCTILAMEELPLSSAVQQELTIHLNCTLVITVEMFQSVEEFFQPQLKLLQLPLEIPKVNTDMLHKLKRQSLFNKLRPKRRSINKRKLRLQFINNRKLRLQSINNRKLKLQFINNLRLRRQSSFNRPQLKLQFIRRQSMFNRLLQRPYISRKSSSNRQLKLLLINHNSSMDLRHPAINSPVSFLKQQQLQWLLFNHRPMIQRTSTNALTSKTVSMADVAQDITLSARTTRSLNSLVQADMPMIEPLQDVARFSKSKVADPFPLLSQPRRNNRHAISVTANK